MLGFREKRNSPWVWLLYAILWACTGCASSTSEELGTAADNQAKPIEIDQMATQPVATTKHEPELFDRRASGLWAKSSKPFSLQEMDRSQGVCMFIVGTDCPISNAYAPELARIVSDFEPRGIRFYLVYSVRGLSTDAALRHASEYGLKGEVILDSNLEVAQALRATRMPEAIVLPATGEAVYQGRIDDRYPAPGAKRREHPTSFDLRDALQAYTSGKPVKTSRTPSVGCPLDFAK